MTGRISRRHLLAGAGALAGVRPTTAGEVLPKVLRVSTFKQTSYLTGYYLQRFAPPGMTIQVS